MITIDLPRDVPRSARAAYFAACLLMDDAGEVPGGMAELHRVLGHDEPARTRQAVRLCEEHYLLWRKGAIAGGPQRLFVVVHRPKEAGCQNCGKPTRGARHCPTCRQAHRADLAWRLDAVHLAVRNLATLGEPKPASVAVAVKRPLFPRVDDESKGGAVVPWLLSQGLLGEEWQRALAEVMGDSRRAAQMVREMRVGGDR